MLKNFTLLKKTLIKHNIHIGGLKYNLNKSFLPYIWRISGESIVIDLNKIKLALTTVLNVIEKVSEKEGRFLFLGHPYDAFIDKLISLTALKSNQYFYKFNFKKLNYSKIKKELKKLKPAVLIVFAIKPSKPIIKIADELNIPVIGICNSDSDPRSLAYSIPSNDKSYKSIYFYCTLFINAILKGKN